MSRVALAIHFTLDITINSSTISKAIFQIEDNKSY
jgi:hypothetical protein